MSLEFAVSPMIQKIELKAGETYTGYITVSNPKSASSDFHFKVETSPYSVIGEEYTPDFQTMSDWSRIVEWTTLENTEGSLKPNETKKVYYKIEVPANAPAGGQYFKIGVTSDSAAMSGDAGKVQDVYEIANLVFVAIEGDTKREGKILDGKISGFVSTAKPSVSARVENNGNVHEIAKTTVTVKNVLGGGQVYPKDGEDSEMESIIMPLSTRLISRELSDMPVVGIFDVKETIEYMGETQDITSVMVICPFWFILLVIAFISSIIGMGFYGRYLKHKKMKKQLHSEKTNVKIEP